MRMVVSDNYLVSMFNMISSGGAVLANCAALVRSHAVLTMQNLCLASVVYGG